MARLTKTEKRKRLLEESEKIWKVMGSFGGPDFSSRDNEELRKARLVVIKMAAKLK